MSATVASLKSDMSIRLSMLDSGLISPPPAVADATRRLVAKLCLLDPAERIEVRVYKNPFRAQYIRANTNEILADFSADIDDSGS
jgi:hypothetical protein